MSSPGNNEKRPTAVRHEVLTWLVLAAAFAYLPRNAVGVAESTIREDLGLTLQQSGWFMSAFFWSYALCQVPSGLVAQKFGTRIALPVFAFGWSAAAFGIGVAPAFLVLILAQLVMGVAQAGLFPAATVSVGNWISLARRSIACGLLAAGMQVGAIAASGLTGRLIEPIGWRWVFVIYAIPGILLAAAVFRFFRDKPENHPRVNEAELAVIQRGKEKDSDPNSGRADLASWLAIAANPSIWFLCGQQICRAAGYMFFASWFPTFLQETRGVSVANSGYLQGLVLAGSLTGAILGGTITDWIWRKTGSLRVSRGGVGAAALVVCAGLILGAWFVKSVAVAATLLAVGAFMAALAGPAGYTSAIDIGGQRVPQVFGLMNMSGNLAAAASPALVGFLFTKTENWNLILLIFAAVYFAGAICWVFVKPERKVG
ncbi:MAG: MFS transporter [Verrucomicrobiales bacterium]|nr:MFS transporter [Verrucomicrobiales bacterium]